MVSSLDIISDLVSRSNSGSPQLRSSPSDGRDLACPVTASRHTSWVSI